MKLPGQEENRTAWVALVVVVAVVLLLTLSL